MENPRIYAIQLDIVWQNRDQNLKKIERLLRETNPCPNSLVVLPEVALSGYSNEIEIIAEKDKTAERTLAALAVQFKITLVCGLVNVAPESHNRGLNQLVGFSPEGKECLRYTKLHPFTYANEPLFFDAGKEQTRFHWQGFEVVPFICYDLRFPEIFRHAITHERGADIFIIAANWPRARFPHWDLLTRARAIENQAFVVAVNRCGCDPALPYAGESRIINPKGEILARASDTECIIQAEPDRRMQETYRQRFPVLKDIRHL